MTTLTISVCRWFHFATLAAASYLLPHVCGQHVAPPSVSSHAASQGQQERQLLDAVARDPNSASAAGALGQYYLRRDKWQASAQWLGKAFALSGGDLSIGHDLAVAQMQAGELDQAKLLTDNMLARKEDAKLHSLLAEVDDRRGAYQDAAREYHRAAELDPSESNIFDVANYLLQHKKYVGALADSIKFFRYGVQQFPRSSQMRVGLGVALYAADEYDEAVRVFCEAIDLDPQDQRPIQFLGRASKVSPALARDVEERLKSFAERYPASAPANYFYALGLWEHGGGQQGRGVDNIERLLRKAELLSPQWYEPHYQLGVVYQAEEHYGQAIGEMKKAVRIDPDFFPAHYRLAVLYNRTGQKALADAEATTVRSLKGKDSGPPAVHNVTE